MIGREIVDSIFIKRLQNVDNYKTLNPMDNKIEQGKILIFIKKCKSRQYIYRFLIEGLIFSSRITNDASVLFITCNGLTTAAETINNRQAF